MIQFYLCKDVMAFQVVVINIKKKIKFIFKRIIEIFSSREPESIVRPKRSDEPEEENKYNEKLEKARSKAVRHLFLIRHGQYNVQGETDKERTLTDLGNLFTFQIML